MDGRRDEPRSEITFKYHVESLGKTHFLSSDMRIPTSFLALSYSANRLPCISRLSCQRLGQSSLIFTAEVVSSVGPGGGWRSTFTGL